MIVEGWFNFTVMERGTLLGFLNGKNLPVARLNVTFIKSVSIRLVFIVIVRPSSLKTAMMFSSFYLMQGHLCF